MELENLLIRGDNLEALQSLHPRLEGRVRLVYLDPPYNTGNAFDHYDDDVAHDRWLAEMRARLEALVPLLAHDGVLVAQIDRNEAAYLKVLLDEVLGRSAYITTIAARMSATSGFKIEHTNRTIVKNTEYLHIYSRKLRLHDRAYEENADYDPHYSLLLGGRPDALRFSRLVDQPGIRQLLDEHGLPCSNDALRALYAASPAFRAFVSAEADRICRSHTAPAAAKVELQQGLLLEQGTPPDRVEERTYAGTRYYLRRTRTSVDQLIPIRLKMNPIEVLSGPDRLALTNILGDWWDGFHLDMGNVENEGGVPFKNGKKPERLLRRILRLFTEPGDLVLDPYAGSGTTGAVAQKMGRRWVLIEAGPQCETHALPRLRAVVEGRDRTGVTAACGWRGGGDFRFLHLPQVQ